MHIGWCTDKCPLYKGVLLLIIIGRSYIMYIRSDDGKTGS